MTKFEQPLFIKPTSPFGDVIIFGKSPEIVANDTRNGVARFGGAWRAPSYLLAYLKAAAIVVNQGICEQCLDEIALPAFYMQRHTLELAIKRLLSWLYELADFRIELGHDNRGIPSNGQLERFKTKHNLGSLLQDLRKTSLHFGFGEPPVAIDSLVRQIEGFELTETWSRYEAAQNKDKTVIHHVKDEVTLPLVDIQRKLETLYVNVMHPSEKEPTYETILYDAWLNAARLLGKAG